MIRCNHCGKLVPTGATSCQSCGMPLMSGQGSGGGGGSFEQQELPAWLESLRAHERPVVSASGAADQQPFSMAELVDENAMPSWMHLDRSRLIDNSSDAFPALSSTAQPGSDADGSSSPASGFVASSLIDEKSLPSWMRGQEEGQAGGEQNLVANSLLQADSLPPWMKNLEGGNPPPMRSAPQAQQPPQMPTNQEMPASSLLQADSLPPWMKNLEGGNPPPMRSAPQAQQPLQMPANQEMPASSLLQADSLPPWMKNLEGGNPPPMRSAQASQPLTGPDTQANSSVQPDALPPWMKNLDGGRTAPSTSRRSDEQYGFSAQGPGAPPAGGVPGMPQNLPITTPLMYDGNGVSQAPTQGFSARDLVDQQSLPNWMTGPQDAGQAGPPKSGFAAGDLLDQQALPAWLKNQQGGGNSGPVSAMGVPVDGSGQVTGRGQETMGGLGMPAANMLDVHSLPPWMSEGQNTPGLPPSGDQGMAAGSLLDVNALPEWLRNAEDAPPAAGARPGPQTPARFDGTRVPGRPRSEFASQEQSEVAANVFASMLGVAASSPTLSGQSQSNLGVAPSQSMQQAQPMQANQAMQAHQSAQPGQPGQPVIPGWQSPQQQQTANPGQGAWQTPGMQQSAASGVSYMSGGQQPAGMNASQLPPQMTGQSAYSGYGDQNRASPGSKVGVGNNNNGGGQGESGKKKGFFDAIRDFFFK